MKVSIVGASGYGGGELLRLLLQHPRVQIHQCTSERFVGKPITRLHPNLRKQTHLKFCSIQDLETVDLIFTALPHQMVVWMSHGDQVTGLSEDFIPLARTKTCPYAAARHKTKPFYGVQFHPEVTHTPRGSDILRNFLFRTLPLRLNVSFGWISILKVSISLH